MSNKFQIQIQIKGGLYLVRYEDVDDQGEFFIKSMTMLRNEETELGMLGLVQAIRNNCNFHWKITDKGIEKIKDYEAAQ